MTTSQHKYSELGKTHARPSHILREFAASSLFEFQLRVDQKYVAARRIMIKAQWGGGDHFRNMIPNAIMYRADDFNEKIVLNKTILEIWISF